MDWQTIICILAAINNFGILLPTNCFCNEQFFKIDPEIFGRKGCAFVILWGACHISVAWDYASVPFIFLVFGLEKLVYIVHWIQWLRKRETWINDVKGDFQLKSFFHLYGLPDLIVFGPAFFAIWVMGMVNQYNA
jgi:hypothetical protein